jgi:hypothetical protein
MRDLAGLFDRRQRARVSPLISANDFDPRATANDTVKRGRHHKSETLRKASKGLVRIHILVSDLSAISEAVSKASERPGLFPLDCSKPSYVIDLDGFFLAFDAESRPMGRQKLTMLISKGKSSGKNICDFAIYRHQSPDDYRRALHSAIRRTSKSTVTRAILRFITQRH